MKSKKFDIKRGTKQGDPLSPQLFNSVLEQAFQEIQGKWRRKGWGVRLTDGQNGFLCNLRFADDVLLIAETEEELQDMRVDVVNESAVVGLELHMGKTKVLRNTSDNAGTEMLVQGHKVDILPTDSSTMHVGAASLHGESTRCRAH